MSAAPQILPSAYARLSRAGRPPCPGIRPRSCPFRPTSPLSTCPSPRRSTWPGLAISGVRADRRPRPLDGATPLRPARRGGVERLAGLWLWSRRCSPSGPSPSSTAGWPTTCSARSPGSSGQHRADANAERGPSRAGIGPGAAPASGGGGGGGPGRGGRVDHGPGPAPGGQRRPMAVYRPGTRPAGTSLGCGLQCKPPSRVGRFPRDLGTECS